MRVLFTFTGGTGHFIPTVPFARALTERGHTVTYACQEGMVPVVNAHGWEAVSTGGRTLLDPGQRRPLVPLDLDAEKEVVGRFFAGKVARERAQQLIGVIDEYRPEVIVRDEVDFGACVAAEARGLPHAGVVVIAAGGFLEADRIVEPLANVRSEYGLTGDPLAMLHRHLTIVPVPPSFRDPRDPLPSTAHHVRPAVLDHNDDSPVAERPVARPAAVYFTLGTIFHQESGDLFGRVLQGLSALPVEIIVTVGNEIDPAELGTQPPNVRIERFIAAADILPECDLVVSHAGSGTVIGALGFGVPQLLLPMGADQPLNADRCAALGVGAVLNALTADGETIRQTARAVLEDRSYRARAAGIRDEIRALPGSEHGAALLEELAATGRATSSAGTRRSPPASRSGRRS